jgi:glycine cleavage system H protein
MSNIPADLRFAPNHEWARVDPNGWITVGISDYAQDALGDILCVELPSVGKTLNAGDLACVVESVKAASDIYSPISGEVAEVNNSLVTSPELINLDAYTNWLFKIKPSDIAELDKLQDAAAYAKVIGE